MIWNSLLPPETAEWLVLAVCFTLIIALVILLGWAAILEIRYMSPYTLIAASANQKWRRAAIPALLQTSVLLLLGLVEPFISPEPDQWPAAPLVCGAVWIVVLPIVTVFKRWQLARSLKKYREVDTMIKGGVYRDMLRSPFSAGQDSS